MPSCVRLYPLGYPVDFEAVSEVGPVAGVLAAARERWLPEPALFTGPPLHFSVEELKEPAAGRACSRLGTHLDHRFEVREDHFEVCAGASGSAVFFPAARRGYLRVSAGLSDLHSFRSNVLEALVLAALDAVFFTPLHAACVVRNRRAVLLCGDSGAGKSSLSYSCVRRGWTLVADDAVHAAPDPRNIVVGASRIIRLREPARALFPELESEAVTMAPNGKAAIEIDLPSRGFAVARTAAAPIFVFLARGHGTIALRPLTAECAASYFRKYLWHYDPSPHESRLRRLLAGGAQRLEYEHLDNAVAVLEGLVRKESPVRDR